MPDCLLKSIDNAPNKFTATAGKLTLNLKDIDGQTQINTIDTSVLDITNLPARIAVHAEVTTTSLSFLLESGKKYLIAPTFVQLIEPFASEAAWNEACGQRIDTINVTNLFPGYIVGVA